MSLCRSRSRLSPSRSRGFTLVELLVVIAIIATLAGLVTTAVTSMRKKAMVAKTAAGMSSIEVAIAAYNTEMRVYPGASTQTPKDDPEALFRALYTANRKHGGSGTNYLDDWSPEDIGLWPGSYKQAPEALYDIPSADQLDFSTNFTPCVLLDAYGRPYHYVEWDSHPKSKRQLPGGELRAIGGKPFMIWSDGPNLTNDWGKEDDISSWGSH